MTRLRACATIYAMPNMEDTKKFQQWLAIAQSGDAEAMSAVAAAYYLGNGVEKDMSQYFAWIKKAADADLPEAMFSLSLAYYNGDGVKKNPQRFFDWTKKAADVDLPEAMSNLAIAYKDGLGVEKNPQQFSDWTKKAAKAGFRKAMFNLAIAYKDGVGVEKDRSQYFAWTKKAAEAGFGLAMFNLAIAYKIGDSGAEKNLEKFSYWVEKAYKKGGVVDAAIMFPFSRLLQNRKIDEPIYNEIVNALSALRDECKSILQEKHRIGKKQKLSHYTKLAALNSILEGGISNHLRLYNVAYFNDPLEGAAFPSALGGDMCEWIYGRKGEIPHEIAVEGKKFSVYACAFSARDDYLPLWIAYGNNGDGYNITGTIPQHMKADEESGAMQDMHRSFSLAKDETATEKTKDALIRVYKVQYGKEAEKTAQKLTRCLKKLQSILQGKSDEVKQKVKAVAEWILADLRYLYKHKAYRWEKEYRIIRVAKFGGEKIKEDDRTPPRFYLETPPFLFAESGGKVTVGPRVAEKDAAEIYIRQRLTKNGWDKTTKIAHSKMPYR